MKKLKAEFSESSPSLVFQAITERWKQVQRERHFDPNEEVYDFNLERKKGEEVRHFYKRQERAIREFVETYLWFEKRGVKQQIKLIRKQLVFLADLFFAREHLETGEPIQAAIVWANRGGGKSLVDAILIYLCMVWEKKSFSDLAGSQEQALEVYDYVCNFWECIPIIKDRLLDGEPLITKTKLKGGVTLKCIANSQNQARGKHPEGFIADETCQKERYKDDNVVQATNSVLTQDEFLIVYSSTFHLPTGIFADTWEGAEALDFKRYKWNIYDCMKKCERNVDCKKCPLTRKKTKRGSDGKIIKTKYFGCNGKARKSRGWLSFVQVMKAKTKAAIRGLNWRVEFECRKPDTAGKVYKTKKVRKSLVNQMVVPYVSERVVGIDFGTNHLALVLAVLGSNSLLVPWSHFSTGNDLDFIVETLRIVRERFGEFTVYADAEQAYGIMHLRKAGFIIEKIAFNKYKGLGIENLNRYFNHKKIKILNNRENRILWRQLLGYKKDEHGNPVKKDDHGPDALMCAGLRFDFMHFFRDVLKKKAASDALKELDEQGKESEVEVF